MSLTDEHPSLGQHFSLLSSLDQQRLMNQGQWLSGNTRTSQQQLQHSLCSAGGSACNAVQHQNQSHQAYLSVNATGLGSWGL
jgi:hypothetical protein